MVPVDSLHRVVLAFLLLAIFGLPSVAAQDTKSSSSDQASQGQQDQQQGDKQADPLKRPLDEKQRKRNAKALKQELGKSYSPHLYEGAGHGFLRQQTGQGGANGKAAEAAWKETIKFLKENTK